MIAVRHIDGMVHHYFLPVFCLNSARLAVSMAEPPQVHLTFVGMDWPLGLAVEDFWSNTTPLPLFVCV